jgi:hypothetical protein
MKLATVNPQMDLNIESLLAKDVSFQSICIPVRKKLTICNCV